MRRKPIIKVDKRYKIYQMKPCIWTPCQICKYEFRREKMYTIDIKWHSKRIDNDFGVVVRGDGMQIDMFYFCKQCCENVDDVKKHYEVTPSLEDDFKKL